MIDRQSLLKDLQPLVKQLEDDLRTRLDEHPPSKALLQADHDTARSAGRTAQTFTQFADDHLTQVAVAWVLATVFVRFVEDNGLCDEPWLSGPGRRRAQARDRYTDWLRHNAELSDREYLRHVFVELGKLPGLAPLLGESHTLLHRIGPTADGARMLREFWLRVDGEGDAAHLRHDFTDPAADTRFLGDLYQDLSEAAKDKYALLQTPIFIEEFLLDQTLEPALAEFGLAEVKLIDPACGSGHFLLGAFQRLFDRWTEREPGSPVQERARKALEAVAGVDLNPFAVSIARFRLLVAALKVCGVHRLAEAYDFRPRVATGDSLLHGRGGMRQRSLVAAEEVEFEHFYGTEDKDLLRSIFGQSYHAVVGNPPYIVPRDRGLNQLYRQRFPEVCHGKYSLGAPFTQLFFELARRESTTERRPPGFVGVITANSFMKREFGKKLIENYLSARADLTGVLDLSGAYIPGHGTPTVILLGRTRAPTGTTIRAVLGIRGEPSTPNDPAQGLVWSAIVDQFQEPGSESEFVSCDDIPRDRLASHPWSIGGGGASELKEQLEGACETKLSSLAQFLGITAVTGEDDLYVLGDTTCARRLGIAQTRPLVVGDALRDWCAAPPTIAAWPYDTTMQVMPLGEMPAVYRLLWPARAAISRRKRFGTPMIERGLSWYEWQELYRDKLRTPLSIAFAEVASHNHFVLDRGGKVFKQTAPIIKLPPEATEDDHLGLLGLLNSSVACFWLKQVCHNKGSTVDQHGARQRTAPFEDFYQYNATRVRAFPIAGARPLNRARHLDRLGDALLMCVSATDLRSREDAEASQRDFRATLDQAVAIQEELDWECYRLYGLIEDNLTYSGDDLPGLELGQRAFEIVLARQVAAGKATTTWFERHGSTPITEIPTHWPRAYRELVQRRIERIEQDSNLRLIEQPEYKRRWNIEPFDKQLERARRSWLLDRMEDPTLWPEPHLTSTARFAERLRRDRDFVQVANLYRGRDDYDFDDLVRELVESEGVPFLPALRYKPSGLRKRAEWEATWALQRREDAGEDVGTIPVPPKYKSGDFHKPTYWKHRGKLDVPKERFILYPFAERSDDPTPVFTWAGFDHQQQAHALVARYVDRKEQDGATRDELLPLLAGLQELIPWLLQWHNDPTPEAPTGYGTAYQDFLTAELRTHELSEDDLKAWRPPARTRGRRRSQTARQTDHP